ncbi:VPS10 domain-containing receptor SorCS1 [Thelohanellus kitauei]|uniref:VPS10 domain-containing receptor SorCS1 n=1 Tax=Thelohanellus kitauei TaxID=669202 RepID=A0A0C2MVN9_THEKT|nr:VPS10 domain-containing receptor SorCS1 [Thelohanellus kitauei]
MRQEGGSACLDGLCNIKFKFPCKINVNLNFPREWIAVLSVEPQNSREIFSSYLVSFNGGKLWKHVPYLNYQTRVLNRGGIIFGINIDSRKIIYSFNEGKTFYHKSIFKENENIISAVKNGHLINEFVSVFGFIGEYWTLTHINFSTIFDRYCEEHEYEEWIQPRVGTNCYQGAEKTYLKKKLDSLCIENKSETVISTKTCFCSYDDFHCRFNYYPKYGYCEIDPFSNLTQHPDKCEFGGVPIVGLNGFSKLDYDICDIEEIDFDEGSEYADFCIAEEYSNYVVVLLPDGLFHCELDREGHYFPKTLFQKIWMPVLNLNSPITYDLSHRELYYYANQTLQQITENEEIFYAKELYRFKIDITKMIYDHFFSFLFLLDKDKNLLLVYLNTNYLKLLAPNVTDFHYSPNNL